MVGLIDPSGFYAASGTLFALAIIAATLRTVTRLHRFRRLYTDDLFLLLATATLIAGSILLYHDVPLAFEQEQVTAGAREPDPDYLDTLVRDERIQYASTTLVMTSIFAVKFSFLSFLHTLLRHAHRAHRIWWTFVLAVTALSAPVLILSDFIACPYTGPDIVTQCLSTAAQQRQNAIVRASVALDIITDVLVISIPVALLWHVDMRLRRKAVLAGSLCLGLFMIICAGVRIGAADIAGGQIDVLWVLLWQQLEACVAVVVVSATAFRGLLAAGADSEDDIGAESEMRRNRGVSGGWSRQSRWGAIREESGGGIGGEGGRSVGDEKGRVVEDVESQKPVDGWPGVSDSSDEHDMNSPDV